MRSKLGEKRGRDPREAGKAINHDANPMPSEGERERKEAMLGGNFIDWSSKESLVRLLGAKIAVREVQPRNRPAFESLPSSLIVKSIFWEVWPPLKMWQRMSAEAAGALSELCSLLSLPWERHPHGHCSSPLTPLHTDYKGKLSLSWWFSLPEGQFE